MTPQEFTAHRTKVIVTLGIGVVALGATYVVDRFLPHESVPSMILTLVLLLISAVCIGRAWLLARELRKWRAL
jgi:hypothetical protein